MPPHTVANHMLLIISVNNFYNTSLLERDALSKRSLNKLEAVPYIIDCQLRVARQIVVILYNSLPIP